MHRSKQEERGAVSLFVVIFTALLVTTITIGFVQLMMKDQRQAMYSDLSESAYDSATAGVEDAKRALLMQQDCIGNSSDDCENIRTAISAQECSTLSMVFDRNSNERSIITSEGDRKLEQAYTCVKIKQNTDDYLGTIDQNSGATLVPLRGTGAFDRITISWALSKDGNDITLPLPGAVNLPQRGEAWPDSYPALLRAQLINGQGSFLLSDFNEGVSSDGGKGSNTLFLYPSSEANDDADFTLDGRRDAASGAPHPAKCSDDVASGAYACKVTLALGSTVPANSETAFLNLMALYNTTDYRVELMAGTTVVPFSGVQPEVDSTGRANDLFRRVVSRVELGGTFRYPVAALETRNHVCKSFTVTTDPADYTSAELCKP